jgi:hypothetical protein
MTTPPSSVPEQARAILQMGGMPIPYARRTKHPTAKDWQTWRFAEADIPKAFPQDGNLGMFDGYGGFTDVDVDSPEALCLAPAFLPATGLVHGRPSKPRSHRWHQCDPAPRTIAFDDPCAREDGVKARLLEVRGLKVDGSVGLQTMCPPSQHPEGEILAWDAYGAPVIIAADVLLQRAHRLAAASLLLRYCPGSGDRHDFVLALAGTLVRAGWTTEEAETFIVPIMEAAGDEKARARPADIRDTFERFAAGIAVTGLPRLAELVTDKRIVDKIIEWLGLRQHARPADAPVPEAERWPHPLDDVAYHGLAGDFVRIVAPNTEADPAGILLQVLILMGTLAGRRPYITVEADRHGLNEFAVLVGESSKARKGTGAGHIKRLAAEVDLVWRHDGFVGGLSSGEGLIDAVRDPIEELKTIREKGQPPRQEMVLVDPGVSDKRLLVFEPEFSRVLRVMLRRENTLSAIVRQAWDGDSVLRVMTRTSKLRATDAHISITGHIGRDELLRYLDDTEAGNGFGNRFCFFCVRRAHVLPFGGRVPVDALAALTTRFRQVLNCGQQISVPFTWSPEAADQWTAVYPELSAGKPGLFGSVVARGEAHVLRFSCQYALLDLSIVIQPVHLRAALALWQYAEDSARAIFGDALGDPTADEILRALRRAPDGLTRTDLWNLFGRHRKVGEIDRALGVLLKYGRAQPRREETGGRPGERWFAVR